MLRALGQLLASSVRGTDIAGRLGGEEFAVLLPGSDAAGAARVAEGLRQLVEQETIEDGGLVLQVTVSIGLATGGQIKPDDATDALGALLRAADHALYRAKTSGRNCVVAA